MPTRSQDARETVDFYFDGQPYTDEVPHAEWQEIKIRLWHLQLAETVLSGFRNVPCIRALLGEDSDGCGCMGCASRAYFATVGERSSQPTITVQR